MTIIEDRPLTRGDTGRVRLEVRDTTMRLALSFVLDDGGWLRVQPGEQADFVIGDRAPQDDAAPPLDVLITLPVPADCQMAVAAVAEGRARAVLDAARPDLLTMTLQALESGLGVLPASVVDASNHVPALSPRLRRTLSLVIAGASNPTIASVLQESPSTAKRDVGSLLRAFDVMNRLSLVSSATRLGFRRGER